MTATFRAWIKLINFYNCCTIHLGFIQLKNILKILQRELVRGKADKKVEFGCKILTSVIDGFSFVEHMSFDNFNEGIYLKEVVNVYKDRFGYYPESVMADTILKNGENISWLKEKVIRISGPRLGKRPKDKEKLAARRKR